MSLKLILVSHDDVGLSMLKAAKIALHQLPFPVQAVSVSPEAEPKTVTAQLQAEIDNIPAEDGVLILTDIFGATPCNIAQGLQCNNDIRVVAGLNLPMLLRVFNYTDLPLEELVQKAIEGGQNGIRACAG
tara:strand:+ start:35852 stop:36241 length:390 start_codon:yes stop_codon:yes gene_type:complete